MPVYIVELLPAAPSINGIRSITVDAHDQSTAREMAAFYSNSTPANWAESTVRKVYEGDSMSGWTLKIQLLSFDAEYGGYDNVFNAQDYVYTFGVESLGSGLATVASQLAALTYRLRIQHEEDEIIPLELGSTLTGVPESYWSLNVAGPATGYGDSLVKVGLFPPGTAPVLNGGPHVGGVTGFITSVVSGGDSADPITINFVGNGWTVPGIPDSGFEGGDPAGSGGAGDPDSTPPDPGSGSAGDGTGAMGPGGTGDPPNDGNTQGPDGDPVRPPVGTDPRDVDLTASGASLTGWFRSDQLVGKIFGRSNILALGNLVNVESALRGLSENDRNGVMPGYEKFSTAFNGHPALNLVSPNGHLVSNVTNTGTVLFPNVVDIHMFMIVRELSHQLNGNWMQGRTDNVFSIRKTTATELTQRNAANSNNVNAVTVPTLGDVFLLEARFTGTAGDFMRINGGAKSGAAAAGSGNVDVMVFSDTLSGGTRAPIEMAELIRFDGGELTGADLQGLYDYLADRYAITISPPV